MNMTMLFLFLSFFASQLFLASPSVIREEQVENNEEPLSSEVEKPKSESIDRNTPPFLRPIKHNIVKERKGHGEGFSLQAESPGDSQVDVRDTPPEKADLEVDACRKVDMIVNAADLGLLDWIIAPAKFNAYQCKGKCSPTQRKSVNHSQLKALIEKKKGIKTSGEACCVPTKLRPISLLYIDKHESVVMGKVNDMIVEECGCY